MKLAARRPLVVFVYIEVWTAEGPPDGFPFVGNDLLELLPDLDMAATGESRSFWRDPRPSKVETIVKMASVRDLTLQFFGEPNVEI